jgi:hypothetical protein
VIAGFGSPDERLAFSSFYLYLHGEVRKASSTKVGDTVTLQVQFDHEYRGGPVHPMPPSRQKEILRYFSRLKSPEAKARNVQQVVHVLSGGKARFMARSWNENKSCSGKPP